MKHIFSYSSKLTLIGCLLIFFTHSYAQTNDVLDRIIKLPKGKATRYELLEKITDETGFLFIYDNNTFDDGTTISLRNGKYTVRNAVYLITGNHLLRLQVIGNHILIHPPDHPSLSATPHTPSSSTHTGWFWVEGHIIDNYTQLPIPFASVSITGTSTGTITNNDGAFRLQIADSLINASLRFTHLGYETLEIENRIIKNSSHTFYLIPKIISLQEVVVRLVNPLRAIEDMLDSRATNNAQNPVYLTSFYREGVNKKKNLINLTEGVFKVYNPPYNHPAPAQAKLLKMRSYRNESEKDTIITKMKSGVQGSFLLDIIKNLPDFLELNDHNPYIYSHTDITTIDNRLANVISFEQRPDITIPFYKGELYIDRENNALLMARFDVHPDYVEDATSLLVEKKSKGIRIAARQVSYTVSYKPWNGTYYINHLRGDLSFNVRKRKQLFNTQIHVWFEMVTCNIETLNVQRFSKRETLPKTNIFSETKYEYDPSFWGNLNIIIPEDELSEALNKINAKIEETGD